MLFGDDDVAATFCSLSRCSLKICHICYLLKSGNHFQVGGRRKVTLSLRLSALTFVFAKIFERTNASASTVTVEGSYVENFNVQRAQVHFQLLSQLATRESP